MHLSRFDVCSLVCRCFLAGNLVPVAAHVLTTGGLIDALGMPAAELVWCTS